MKTKSLLASLAMAGLALAQPVYAATRSVDSLPVGGLRVAAPVTNANYQDDDDGASTEVILGVVLVVLIGIAALSGGGGSDSP